MESWVAEFFSVDEWVFAMHGQPFLYAELFLLLIGKTVVGRCRSICLGLFNFSRHIVRMVEHAHGDVCDVGFVTVFWLPAGIEELGVDLHLVRSEFVGYILPAFHTVLIGPQPHLSPLVYQRLHGLYFELFKTATSQPKLVLRLTEIVCHHKCGLLTLHEIHLRLGVSFQQVGAEQRF